MICKTHFFGIEIHVIAGIRNDHVIRNLIVLRIPRVGAATDDGAF